MVYTRLISTIFLCSLISWSLCTQQVVYLLVSILVGFLLHKLAHLKNLKLSKIMEKLDFRNYNLYKLKNVTIFSIFAIQIKISTMIYYFKIIINNDFIIFGNNTIYYYLNFSQNNMLLNLLLNYLFKLTIDQLLKYYELQPHTIFFNINNNN